MLVRNESDNDDVPEPGEANAERDSLARVSGKGKTEPRLVPTHNEGVADIESPFFEQNVSQKVRHVIASWETFSKLDIDDERDRENEQSAPSQTNTHTYTHLVLVSIVFVVFYFRFVCYIFFVLFSFIILRRSSNVQTCGYTER